MSATATLSRTPLLRRTLWADAATCLGTGLLLAALAAPLSPLLGLPAALLQYAGLALLPIAAFIALTASRPSPAMVWLVIAGNVLWVAGSVAVLFVFAPTALGMAFVIAQGVVVAVLAEVEYVGLRRG